MTLKDSSQPKLLHNSMLSIGQVSLQTATAVESLQLYAVKFHLVIFPVIKDKTRCTNRKLEVSYIMQISPTKKKKKMRTQVHIINYLYSCGN